MVRVRRRSALNWRESPAAPLSALRQLQKILRGGEDLKMYKRIYEKREKHSLHHILRGGEDLCLVHIILVNQTRKSTEAVQTVKMDKVVFAVQESRVQV